jgi:hypothetical protein
LIERYGPIEAFPREVLGARRELALLFKDLATLRTNAAIPAGVDAIRWRGPADHFDAWTERLGAPKLAARLRAVAQRP